MLFSRVATFFAFIFTLVILAVAKPVELESRASAASVESVVTTLKSKTDVIVPQIKSASAEPNVSAATIAPLITELVSALNTAHTSLTSQQFTKLKSRQTESDVANTFAGIVRDIADGTEGLKGLPGLAGLFVSLDVALAGVLTGLDILLVGVGVLVGGLLTDVAGVLLGLGLGLTLGLLGL